MFTNRPIILASASPRRSQLLQEAGYQFTTQRLDCDESYPDSLKAYEVAEFVANKKATMAHELLSNDKQIIITADSVVALDNVIYGKPKDKQDAYRILCFLSGKKHTVYTGVCIFDSTKNFSFTSKTDVFFREFTHEEITWYIDNYNPVDKAGSYGIQEWIGLSKISRIEGSYSNVMGLPMDLVYVTLQLFT